MSTLSECSKSVPGQRHRESGELLSDSTNTDFGVPIFQSPDLRPSHSPGDLDSWGASNSSGIPLLPDVGPIDEKLSSQLHLSRTALPVVGSTFLGFRLVAELGRGAFGRVFLAEQVDLANRLVALKVSTESITESQKLAQLQHTHIVPIYSFHQVGPLQALCMPYFGSATLSDVLYDLQQCKALPNSGRRLVSTLQNRQSQTARSADSHRSRKTLLSQSDSNSGTVLPLPAATQASHPAGLRQLEGFSYVEAVLSLGARLADGLAHAHEHGILHRDLKPANILLTDEGQPMLLDFNLAADTKQSVATAMIGGTLPYMSPEHLAAFQGHETPVDHRSDIYALGLILTELLLGRPLFVRYQGLLESTLPRMIAERNQQPPALRKINPDVTPATEAILRRCLNPNPALRYQSARDLQEDLQRQLNNQPLKHTPEPSRIERIRKWARRNPRLTSMTTLAIASTVVILALGATLLARSYRLARLDAQELHRSLSADLSRARILLAGKSADPTERDEGKKVALSALDRFAAPDAGTFVVPQALPPEEQTEVRTQLAEVLFLLAGTQSDLQGALDYNTQAVACLGEDSTPRALHLQRADLLHRLGREIEAQQERDRAVRRAVRTSWEQALLAREQMRQGEVAAALDQVREVVRKDPSNVSAWYLLGNCALEGVAHQLAQETDAVAAYTACLALAPEYPGLFLSRGLVQLRLKNYREAEADFSRVLELKPALALAYLHRAQAWEGLGQPEKALADVNAALEGGVTLTRAYGTRARLRAMLGDFEGSKKDRTEVLTRQPTDEESYIVRGVMRLATDVPAALADFESAARLNPRSLPGLHNQAHVLAEKLNQPREAIARLDQVLKAYPNLAQGYAGRAVLHARLGDRARAHRDARKALSLDGGGETAYQVAGVYALTSTQQPQDREMALACLAQGLRQGYGLDLVEGDPDLAGLKEDPRRNEIVKAARTLQRRAAALPKEQQELRGDRP